MNLILEVGMHNRIGSGRVRHLDVKWFWTHGSRASWAVLIEERWDIQQRERSDDETSR